MRRKINNQEIARIKSRSFPINQRAMSIDISGKLLSKEKSFDKYLDERVIRGYAVLWGQKNSHDEIFVKGCFSKSISDLGPDSKSSYKIKLRDRHGKSVSLFSKLIEDEVGLYFESVPLDKVSWADDMLEQIRTGTINNFSIGFNYVWDKVEYDDNLDAYIMLEVRLYEVSGVDIPSDMTTYVVRSFDNQDEVKDEIEAFIKLIDRKHQIKARHLFSVAMSLSKKEQLDREKQALFQRQQSLKKRVDYSYLNKNFKL